MSDPRAKGRMAIAKFECGDHTPWTDDERTSILAIVEELDRQITTVRKEAHKFALDQAENGGMRGYYLTENEILAFKDKELGK